VKSVPSPVSNDSGAHKIVADLDSLNIPKRNNGAVHEDDDEMRTRRDSLAHLAPVPDVADALDKASPASARLCPSCGNVVPAEFGFCGQGGWRLDGKHVETERNAVQPGPQGFTAEGRLVLIRPDGTEGGTHNLREGENIIGRGLGPLFDADGYLSP